uniref:Alpha-2-HS-glycoprotein n=1 Tax=Geotrypetes seraphini TaxID=260995 RepID=A0A6P8S5V3_GEOSA|nr:alpha-2-HS-glycoprotein [Geotrypetes seraphini]
MRSLFLPAWLIYIQLFSCTALPVAFKPPYEQLDCNDPEVEKLALLGVDHINRRHNNGYKYTLNKIEDAKKCFKGSEEIYDLEVDMLETICPLISPEPSENCPVREKKDQPIEGECEFKLVMSNGTASVRHAKCTSKIDSAEHGAVPCLGCPKMVPLNHTDLLQAVTYSLKEYNSLDDQVYYQLMSVCRGTIQVIKGFRVKAEYTITATNCTNQQASESPDNCAPRKGNETVFGFCAGSVTIPSLDEPMRSDVLCKIYDDQHDSDFHHMGYKDSSGATVPHTELGYTFHNLRYSNFGPQSSESSSTEDFVPVVNPLSPVIHHPIAKRSVAAVDPVSPQIFLQCPGTIRFY